MNRPERTWSLPRPAPGRMSPRWVRRDEPPPDDSFFEYLGRNATWIREKRAYYVSHRKEVEEIIEDGDSRAREVARATMAEVREAMQLG